MFSYTFLFFMVGMVLVGIGFVVLVALFFDFLNSYGRTSNACTVSENKAFVCAGFSLLCAGIFLLCLSQNEDWLRKDLSCYNNRIENLEHEKKIIEQKINDFEADENRILSSDEFYEYSALHEVYAEVYKKAKKLSEEAADLENDIKKKKVKKIKKQLKEETLK